VGIIVKFYIISDRANIGIHILNTINATGNSAIMSENFRTWQGQMEDLDKVSRSYDFYIIASQSPNKANIEANKIENIKACIMISGEDLREVMRESEPNALVLSSSLEKQEISNYVKEFVRNVSGATTVLSQKGSSTAAKPIEKKQKPKQRKMMEDTEEETEVEEEKEQKQKDEETEEDEGPKGKGLLAKFKYTFGFD
jgi:hypothetical protein